MQYYTTTINFDNAWMDYAAYTNYYNQPYTRSSAYLEYLYQTEIKKKKLNENIKTL
jgi:hypothetical protein